MIYCEKQRKLVDEESFCLLCDCKHQKEIEKIRQENQLFELSILRSRDPSVAYAEVNKEYEVF